MRIAISILAAAIYALPGAAQQTTGSSAVFVTERDAAIDALSKAELLLNDGSFGPRSKTCGFITDAIEHFTMAAAAINALAPGTSPTMLTNEQRQVLNRKVGTSFERNEAIRKTACKAA